VASGGHLIDRRAGPGASSGSGSAMLILPSKDIALQVTGYINSQNYSNFTKHLCCCDVTQRLAHCPGCHSELSACVRCLNTLFSNTFGVILWRHTCLLWLSCGWWSVPWFNDFCNGDSQFLPFPEGYHTSFASLCQTRDQIKDFCQALVYAGLADTVDSKEFSHTVLVPNNAAIVGEPTWWLGYGACSLKA